MSLSDVTVPDVSEASQGEAEPSIPPTTHRWSEVQASVRIELFKDATLDHVWPKFLVRTIRHPVESFARPTHFVPAQFSDVSAAHVTVEKPVRGVHAVPPSVVTYTAIPLEELIKLAMHSSVDAHASDVNESCDGTTSSPTDDHVVPPSFVTRKRSLDLKESKIAHVRTR